MYARGGAFGVCVGRPSTPYRSEYASRMPTVFAGQRAELVCLCVESGDRKWLRAHAPSRAQRKRDRDCTPVYTEPAAPERVYTERARAPVRKGYKG